METTTVSPPSPPVAPVRPLAAVRRYAGQWGLIAALAALPVYYGVHDLVYGYQVTMAGHPVIHHDLSNLGFDFGGETGDDALEQLFGFWKVIVDQRHPRLSQQAQRIVGCDP